MGKRGGTARRLWQYGWFDPSLRRPQAAPAPPAHHQPRVVPPRVGFGGPSKDVSAVPPGPGLGDAAAHGDGNGGSNDLSAVLLGPGCGDAPAHGDGNGGSNPLSAVLPGPGCGDAAAGDVANGASNDLSAVLPGLGFGDVAAAAGSSNDGRGVWIAGYEIGEPNTPSSTSSSSTSSSSSTYSSSSLSSSSVGVGKGEERWVV